MLTEWFNQKEPPYLDFVVVAIIRRFFCETIDRFLRFRVVDSTDQTIVDSTDPKTDGGRHR